MADSGRSIAWKCEGCGWTNLGYVPECDGCGEHYRTASLSREQLVAKVNGLTESLSLIARDERGIGTQTLRKMARAALVEGST